MRGLALLPESMKKNRFRKARDGAGGFGG